MLKKGGYLYYAMANGMFYFAWGIFASIISVVLAGRSMSATQISLISSAASLFAMGIQPLAGMFADKFRSPQKIGIICLILAGASGLGFGYSHSFIFLFLMNGFTQGFLNGTVGLSDRLAIASEYTYGSIRVWGSALYAIAAQISGIVYDNYSETVIYYIFAAGMAFAILGFMGMINVAAQLDAGQEKVTTKEIFNALIHNKKFLLFVAILCVYQGALTAQFTYFPLFMQELGGSTTLIGTTLFLMVISEIPTVLFSERIFKRFSYRSLMIFAATVSLIRFGWYATLPSPKLIMVIFIFQGLSSILITLIAVRIIVDVVDDKYVNSAYGISSMLARGLSALIFVIVAGRVIDMFPGIHGYQLMYIGVSVALVVVLALMFIYKDE